MQRITYIVRNSVWPLNGGGRLRDHGIWQALKKVAEVSVIVLGDDPGWEARAYLKERGIAVYPGKREFRKSKRYARYIKSVLEGEDVSAGRFLTPKRRARLEQVVRNQHPDLIILGNTILAPLQSSFASIGVPIIIDTHNVESVLTRRMASCAKNPLRRMLGYAHAEYLARLERTLLPKFKAIWSVSEDDAEYYRKTFPSIPVHIVPNVVNVAGYPTVGEVQRDMILFVGFFPHWPNQDAARRLIGMSRSLAERGIQHRMLLVGRRMPEHLVQLAAEVPTVEVTGEVPDVKPYLASCAFVAAPIHAGSGSNLKLIEAMAAGRAALTTPLGLEGLGAVPGEHLVLATDDDEFLEKMVWCLEHPDEMETIGRNARRWVDAHLSQTALDRIIANLVGEPAHSAETTPQPAPEPDLEQRSAEA